MKISNKKFVFILIFLAVLSAVIWGLLLGASNDGGGIRAANVILEHGLFSNHFGLDIMTDRIFYGTCIAILFKLFGQHDILIIIVQIFVYLGLVLLIYQFAREFFSEKLARLASFIAAICYTLASYVGWFYREILFTSLVLLLIYLLYKAQLKNKNVWFILSGLIFGIATLTNGILQFFLPIIIVNFLFLNRKKIKQIIPKLGLFLIACLLIMSPWLISNYLNFDKTPFPFGVQSGLIMSMRVEKLYAIKDTYFQHLVANTTGDYVAKKIFDDYDRREARLGYQNRKEWKEMVYQEGKDLDELDEELNRQAAIEMLKHPILSFQMATIDFLKFNTPMVPDVRMQHMFAEPGSHSEFSDFTKISIILAIRLFYFVLAGFIVYAMIKYFRDWSKLSWIILIVLYFNLFFAAIHAIARYSLPVYPFYIFLFSLGLLTFLAKKKIFYE